MIFIVKYSLEKDIWNHLNSNWQFHYRKHGRKNIQKKLLQFYPEEYRRNLAQAKTEKKARAVIKDFLISLPQSFQEKTVIIAKGVEKVLNENKKEIITSLEKVYGKPFPFKKIIVYLTTGNIFPYNYQERWFMTGRNSSFDRHIRIAKHELNHFMFYYYYPHLRHKLGTEKFELLKEALVIFTNPEGNDKPSVKKLEEHLKTLAGNPMDEIIDKALKTHPFNLLEKSD